MSVLLEYLLNNFKTNKPFVLCNHRFKKLRKSRSGTSAYKSDRTNCKKIFDKVIMQSNNLNISSEGERVGVSNAAVIASSSVEWIKRCVKCDHRKLLRSPKFYFLIICFSLYCVYVNFSQDKMEFESYGTVYRSIEKNLIEHLKFDKGTGCKIPHLDPFSKEADQFYYDLPKITCEGRDWVKCYHSNCKVVEEILKSYSSVVCEYRDLIYKSDFSFVWANPLKVRDDGIYHLRRSDHASVKCWGYKNKWFFTIFPTKWSGFVTAFRSNVSRKDPPKGRENTINVMLIAYDSTSRVGFIRLMPKSYKYLTEHLQATVLKSYNIVGDGTKHAVTPILTGKCLYELPDARRREGNDNTCDDYPFIFYKVTDVGYRTAYFEDCQYIGTYQYWLNGFRHQPVDHYLRAFFKQLDEQNCVGDTPQYKLMMDLTSQFMHLDGKKFIFTFIGRTTHEDYNGLTTADEDFVEFLKSLKDEGHLNNTLLVVMGDHGPRFIRYGFGFFSSYNRVRLTPYGRLEERLPFMSIVLPEKLKAEKPNALLALQHNADTLTTPYDIHETLLDALDLREYWNSYKVPGADIPRGMTLLEPIPLNRSCSEAGVEPHWCLCVSWTNISQDHKHYKRASEALVDFINGLTEPVRSICSLRTLTDVSWVLAYGANDQMRDKIYQVKLTVGPGVGVFEASTTYFVDEDKFHVNTRDVSRINSYAEETGCISMTKAYRPLLPYCHCAK